MSDRDASRLKPEDPELVHQRRVVEVDRAITDLLVKLREIGVHDKTIIVGLAAASARFYASAIESEGNVVSVRSILTTSAVYVNKAAETLLAARTQAPEEGATNGEEALPEHPAP